MRCGLLGKKLGHSYSPQIHSYLGNYSYHLFEKAPDELEEFLRSGDFSGLNITIPYKKEVIPWSWDFVTNYLKLDPKRLWITIYETILSTINFRQI